MRRTKNDPEYAPAWTYQSPANVAFWRSKDDAYWHWHLRLYLRVWLYAFRPNDRGAIIHFVNTAIGLMAMEAL